MLRAYNTVTSHSKCCKRQHRGIRRSRHLYIAGGFHATAVQCLTGDDSVANCDTRHHSVIVDLGDAVVGTAPCHALVCSIVGRHRCRQLNGLTLLHLCAGRADGDAADESYSFDGIDVRLRLCFYLIRSYQKNILQADVTTIEAAGCLQGHTDNSSAGTGEHRIGGREQKKTIASRHLTTFKCMFLGTPCNVNRKVSIGFDNGQSLWKVHVELHQRNLIAGVVKVNVHHLRFTASD